MPTRTASTPRVDRAGAQTSAPVAIGQFRPPVAPDGATARAAAQPEPPLALGACHVHGVAVIDPKRSAWQEATLAAAHAMALELCPTPEQVAWLYARLRDAVHAENNAWQVALCYQRKAEARTPRGLPVVHPDPRDPQPARVGGAEHP